MYIDKVMLNGKIYGIGDSSRMQIDRTTFTVKDCIDAFNSGTNRFYFTESGTANYGDVILNFDKTTEVIIIAADSYTYGDMTNYLLFGFLRMYDNSSFYNAIAAIFPTYFIEGTKLLLDYSNFREISDLIDQYSELILADSNGQKVKLENNGSVLNLGSGDEYNNPVTLQNVEVSTPTSNNQPANKSYVDNQIQSIQSTLNTINNSISTLNSFMNKYNSMLQTIYNG